MDEDEKAAAEAAAKEAAEKEAAAEAERLAREAAEKEAAEAAKKAGGDDEVAELKAKLAELQGIADRYSGIDPEKAKADAAKVEAAEKAALEAEKAKAKAEGDFEKLREIQNQESAAIVAAEKEARAAAEKERDEARAELSRARIETAFANSKFLQDDTILSGPKAQRLFADYVEDEGGKVVVYDKPRGEAKRAKVMDAKGNPLPFNDAIAKVINADPDKDALLKTKLKPGGSSTTTDGKSKQPEGDRHAKLAAGLKALREK